MDSITSLSGLIKVLKQSDAEDYVSVAKNMKLPVSDFDKYAHWKEDSYARNCVIKTDKFELILICWKGKDFTPIHCHNDQKCWVYMVNGEMTEIRYKQNEDGSLTETNYLNIVPGNLTYMDDNMGFHLLKNTSDKKAMTLHLYIKPVEACNVFDDDKKCFNKRELSFHTIDGQLQN
ncbi:MAG: cysteine dioxygenase [Vicingaceae bacterium]